MQPDDRREAGFGFDDPLPLGKDGVAKALRVGDSDEIALGAGVFVPRTLTVSTLSPRNP